MANKDADFLESLRAAFQVEAAEHLQSMSSGLLELEKAGDAERRREIIANVFRDAHSLKGAARAVNLMEVETVCQSLESVLAAWRRRDVHPAPELLDPLHASVRTVERLLCAPDAGSAPPTGDETSVLLHDLARLEMTLQGGEAAVPATDNKGRAALAPADSPGPPIRRGRRKPTRETAGVTETSPPAADPPAHTDPPKAEPPPAPTAPPAQRGPSDAPTAPARAAEGQPPPPSSRTPRAPHSLPDTLRVSTAKLDALLRQAEEMLAVKLTAGQRAADVRSVVGGLELWEKEWTKVAPELRSVRKWLDSGADSDAGDDGSAEQAANAPEPTNGRAGRVAVLQKGARSGRAAPAVAKLLEFLEWNQNHIRSLHDRLGVLGKSAEHDRRSAGTMVDALLESSKKLLMFPAATLLEMFPRLVRELSRDQGKDVDLLVTGGEVEIDKRILEEMKDPLIHLLRNAVDHGVEAPEKRARDSKAPRATITLAVAQVDGNKVEIVVGDDGAGIDPARVKAAAIRRGAVPEEEAARLNEQELIELIFKPEVSTSPILTEISGRGLGMDIVKAKVEKLGGRVEVQTQLGAGTTFRLLLPLTLATFRGILVRSGDQLFVVPTAGVERVVRVKPEEVKAVENRDTLQLNGRAVSFVRLDDVLELDRPPQGRADAREEARGNARPPAGTGDAAAASEWVPVVVLVAGGKRIAFRVDAVLNEQEVLVKRLGMPLSRVRNVAGATVLGTGRPVPVLNVDDLMKSAARHAGRAAGLAPGTGSASDSADDDAREHQRILVADDSITARMLVKNILESAGHRVTTAVDGLDALTALKTEDFDMVVSDVEMPRMSGFELTAKIRADPRLAEIPVILVTALASREDRERGVDVGASAYIVKSSFDQSDLLAVVRRLA